MTIIVFQMSLDCDVFKRPQAAKDLMKAAYEEKGPGFYVFPEYYLAQFYTNPAKTISFTEAIPGQLTEPFLEFAAGTQSVVVVGMLEKSMDPVRPYNSAAILGPNGMINSYRKTHLWDLGQQKEPYRECKLFTPGKGLDVFDIAGCKIGIMICADGLFPEVPRCLALNEADIILYPNSRESVGVEAQAAAVSNCLPIAVSNPVGFNGADNCQGSSRIIASDGRTVCAVQNKKQGWVAAEFDLTQIRTLKKEACVQKLRRPELYTVITKCG